MAINVYRSFQVVFLYLELVVDSLVVVKRMGIFGPGGYLQLDAKGLDEVRY